jgi:hypothetical protein
VARRHQPLDHRPDRPEARTHPPFLFFYLALYVNSILPPPPLPPLFHLFRSCLRVLTALQTSEYFRNNEKEGYLTKASPDLQVFVVFRLHHYHAFSLSVGSSVVRV